MSATHAAAHAAAHSAAHAAAHSAAQHAAVPRTTLSQESRAAAGRVIKDSSTERRLLEDSDSDSDSDGRSDMDRPAASNNRNASKPSLPRHTHTAASAASRGTPSKASRSSAASRDDIAHFDKADERSRSAMGWIYDALPEKHSQRRPSKPAVAKPKLDVRTATSGRPYEGSSSKASGALGASGSGKTTKSRPHSTIRDLGDDPPAAPARAASHSASTSASRSTPAASASRSASIPNHGRHKDTRQQQFTPAKVDSSRTNKLSCLADYSYASGNDEQSDSDSGCTTSRSGHKAVAVSSRHFKGNSRESLDPLTASTHLCQSPRKATDPHRSEDVSPKRQRTDAKSTAVLKPSNAVASTSTTRAASAAPAAKSAASTSSSNSRPTLVAHPTYRPPTSRQLDKQSSQAAAAHSSQEYFRKAPVRNDVSLDSGPSSSSSEADNDDDDDFEDDAVAKKKTRNKQSQSQSQSKSGSQSKPQRRPGSQPDHPLSIPSSANKPVFRPHKPQGGLAGAADSGRSLPDYGEMDGADCGLSGHHAGSSRESAASEDSITKGFAAIKPIGADHFELPGSARLPASRHSVSLAKFAKSSSSTDTGSTSVNTSINTSTGSNQQHARAPSPVDARRDAYEFDFAAPVLKNVFAHSDKFMLGTSVRHAGQQSSRGADNSSSSSSSIDLTGQATDRSALDRFMSSAAPDAAHDPNTEPCPIDPHCSGRVCVPYSEALTRSMANYRRIRKLYDRSVRSSTANGDTHTPAVAARLQADRERLMVARSRFCRLHTAEQTIIPQGQRLGYPLVIDFRRVALRVQQMRPLFVDILERRLESVFLNMALDVFRELGVWKAQANETKLLRIDSLQCGYYGWRGGNTIFKTIQALFRGSASELKPAATSPLSVTDYIQNVLVPEAAMRLIAQDKGLDMTNAHDAEAARQTMDASASFGACVHGDLAADDSDPSDVEQ